jgi:hypothetical protein
MYASRAFYGNKFRIGVFGAMSQTVVVEEEKQAGKRKKKSRGQVYTSSVSFRTSFDDYKLLQGIANFERLELVDLLRQWISEKRKSYRKDGGFKRWLERHPDVGPVLDLL